MRSSTPLTALSLLVPVAPVTSALAQTAEAERPPAAASSAAPDTPPASPPFTIGGYAEASYQWNFNAPENGITNFRGYDNRHNTFTLSNVALDAQWDAHDVVGRLTLQVGHTPSTYYASEPSFRGAGGANVSGAELWKYLQQAYVGYRFGVAEGLTVSAGLFLSPIGPESIAVRDDWNWSRSNLFFALPAYHTGLRATLAATKEWAVTLAGYNGWNSVVDNNAEKSISAQATFTRSDLVFSILTFSGVERPEGAPEGRGWRHLIDGHVTWNATAWFSLLGHADAGLEPTTFGLSTWAAGALYARFQIAPPLFFAVRGDAFYEHAAADEHGAGAPIFFPTPWVASATATVDVRPHQQVSFRLELRHDRAAGDIYFGGSVDGDGDAEPYVPNRAAQTTVTGGATAWF